MRTLSILAAALLPVPVMADVHTTLPDASQMPQSDTTGMIRIDGGTMYYATFGEDDGTPILLIHGGLAHADLWGAQVEDLSADHRVVVADTRGHGRSTSDGRAYSYEQLAADYVALLDQLEIEQVHLVGWSDGANIGYVLSTTDPGRLASHFAHAGNVTLAGIDPSVETDETFGTYVGAMAEDYARLSTTPDGWADFFGGVATMWGTEKPGGVAALNDVRVPTTVVQSEHDEAIRPEHAAEIAAAIPGARLVTLEGVSHFALLQDPDGYAAAIRDHLDWVDGR